MESLTVCTEPFKTTTACNDYNNNNFITKVHGNGRRLLMLLLNKCSFCELFPFWGRLDQGVKIRQHTRLKDPEGSRELIIIYTEASTMYMSLFD